MQSPIKMWQVNECKRGYGMIEKLHQQNYLAVDVETTGLSAGIDEMIEIGAVHIIDGELKESYQSFICPEQSLPERITEITGITKGMLKKARPLEEVLPEFLTFAKDVPLLGHNLSFDYSFLKAACKKQGVSFERKGIDTLRLARILLPSLERKTLEAVTKFYGISQKQAHRAGDDAISCAKVYLSMLEEFGTCLDKQELFLPQSLKSKVKKSASATEKQKKYLLDLLKYHRIEKVPLEGITKREASAMIDYLRSGQIEKVISYSKSKK